MKTHRRDFDAFLRMVLKGQSDLVYRAYDLDDTSQYNRIWCYKFAGLIPLEPDIPEAYCNMEALKLQRDLLVEGFEVIPFERIDDLVKQFWAYWRISNHHRKGKKRPPEVTHRMYMEHLESLAKEANRGL